MWQPIKAWKRMRGLMAVKVVEERSRECSRGSRGKKASFCLSLTRMQAHTSSNICVDVLHVQCAHNYTHTTAFGYYIRSKEGGEEIVRVCVVLQGGGTLMVKIPRF